MVRRIHEGTQLEGLLGCKVWLRATRGGHQPWDKGGPYRNVWHAGRNAYPHQVSWGLEHGPIPEGTVPHHVCGVRLCCEETHLRLVTNAENARLAIKKRVCR